MGHADTEGVLYGYVLHALHRHLRGQLIPAVRAGKLTCSKDCMAQWFTRLSGFSSWVQIMLTAKILVA